MNDAPPALRRVTGAIFAHGTIGAVDGIVAGMMLASVAPGASGSHRSGVARMSWRVGFVAGLTVLAFAAAWLIPAVPQPLAYHGFADHRGAFGVQNFFDVVSNGGFLVVGLVGLVVTLSRRARFEFDVERWPYAIFFVGILLTAAGSAYYHLDPDNETLFWDRLPMTIAFMALVASQVVDRIDIRAGLALLAPMLVLGVASVIYWRVTERAGAGNVVPYGVLQAYSVVVLLLMALLTPSRYTRGRDVFWVFGWYVLSKILEALDAQVLEFGDVVSGHTLKHLAAAMSGVAVISMLARRELSRPDSRRAPSLR
jgi:hypothetical protein